ncbi:hypothetical protein, partial [Photorhabdus sp. RM157S]|uniref:hypothetical protein n=1 Tax=Photorhabdus sp. RM157S TaxID=3342827 RepID=UPI0036D8A215
WQDHTRPEAAGTPIADRQTGQVQQAPTAVKPVAGINTCLSYTNILTCPLVIELFPHRLISITNTT